MSNKCDEDDILQYLPVLKKESTSKELIDDFNTESSWYENFMNEVKDDVEPNKLHDLVVDYLICGGYYEAAQLLCEDAKIKYPEESTINVDTLEKRNAIRNSIVTGDLESTLVQIEELAPNLLSTNSELHFKLLRQQLVELIRKKDIDKVLSFAQDNLVDKCEQPPDLFTKLEQTYALLAFDYPEKSPFGYLMSTNQRNMLASEVNASILAYLNKNPTSKLEDLFRIIIWNHNQLITKGDSIDTSKPFCSKKSAEISKELFGHENDDFSIDENNTV